jgi:hypothetical protein
MSGEARSVITVDVKSEAFENFQKKFSAYSEQVKKMPEGWEKVGQATEGANKSAEDFLKHLTEASPFVVLLGKHQGEVEKNAKSSLSVFKKIERVTFDITSNIVKATFNLAKWAAFGGAIGLATGFFGAEAIAGVATRQRSDARMLGITPGQLKAARDVYGAGGYFDPDTVLGNLRATLLDPSKRGFLNILGVSGSKLSENPAELLPEVIKNAVDIFKHGGVLRAQALGVGNIFDMPTLASLSSLSPDELDNQGKRFGQLSSSLNINDKTLSAWERLQQQFATAGDQLEKLFIVKLVRLAPAIEKFSDSIVRAISTFADNPNIGKWIGELGDGIEHAAKYLGSDEFQANIDTFVNWIGEMSNKIAVLLPDLDDLGKVLHVLAHPYDSAVKAISDLMPNNPTVLDEKQHKLRALEAQHHLPSGVLSALYGLESANGTLMSYVKSGAEGPFQIKPGTAKDYGVSDPYNFDQASNAAARYLEDSSKQFNSTDPYLLIASYHEGRAKLKEEMEDAPGNYRNVMSDEGRQELVRAQKYFPNRPLSASQSASPPPYVKIDIMNSTGGSATVQTTQLGAQQ